VENVNVTPKGSFFLAEMIKELKLLEIFELKIKYNKEKIKFTKKIFDEKATIF
jgi:hypothetical protein